MGKQTQFSRRLRELRIAAGLTQTALAEKAKMHRSGIAKLETGERDPTWETVQSVARALNTSCEAFSDSSADEQPADESEKRKRGRPKKSP
jgi:transcriptional regulator with XRE-family HTH domain